SETFQILDNFTWIHGHHTIKFGGEYHRYDVQSFNDNLERGLLDVNTCVSQSDGSCPTLSDDRIVNGLANFYIGNIFGLVNARNNFQLRLDISLKPRHNTVVRAGYDYYYDYTPQNNLVANFTNSAGIATHPVPSLSSNPFFVGALDFNPDPFNGTATGTVFTPT